MEFIFFLLLFLSVYSYFIYPLVMAIWPKKPLRYPEAQSTPKVSLIITARNEEKRLREKLEDCLKMDYPSHSLEILIASDCSDDATDEIVMEYSGKGVRLVRALERRGKEYAQSLAIDVATGDIIIFSDVATRMDSDAFKAIAREFGSPEVGAVSSEDRFISQDGSVAGEGLYVRYEMKLRQMESEVNSIVGMSGSFFAVRKEVAQYNWDIFSPSDFNCAINCYQLGMRAVSSKQVFGYYKDISNPSKEYERKIRTVVRGMTGLSRQRVVLNPIRFGLFSYQLWSHKLMRWLEPWFMLSLFLVTMALLNSGGIYQLMFIAQSVFYGAAIAAHISPTLRGKSLLMVIYFFCQVNLAMADAGVRFLRGERFTVWTPSKR